MTLKNDISSWDGKSAQDIVAIYDKHHLTPNFIDNLLACLETPTLQKGATWLLKKHCEKGGEVEENQIVKIYALLPKYEHWETKLHILQIMPYFPIPSSAKNEVALFLRHCLEQSQKFVRAWSYNGFYELAYQYPKYQDEAKQLFEIALNDEAASVKARVRNILKKGF